uniref:Uncharacterized protein n=1 Tax=Arundo donax TaxID=35708 RepID=A0A0A8ZFN9_ARUDO
MKVTCHVRLCPRNNSQTMMEQLPFWITPFRRPARMRIARNDLGWHALWFGLLLHSLVFFLHDASMQQR